MGQILHGSATTTHAVRAAIQRSKASIQELSERYGVNPKTVTKWKKRDFVDDTPMGPKDVRSTVLSKEEEALVVAFRRHTLLPLDDCLYALQATIPHLTRSSLHRLFQRHDISRLPDIEGAKPRKKFKTYPIGYFHIDIAEVWTEEGKLYMFVAIDRVSKFAFAELHERATRRIAADFLRKLIETRALQDPHRSHRQRHSLHSARRRKLERPGDQGDDRAQGDLPRPFLRLACAHNDIDHRLTKPNHPWTNGQVERMNRTIKEATVRRYYYDSHDSSRPPRHFLDAYNFGKRLKTLKGLTPYEYICKIWTNSRKGSG